MRKEHCVKLRNKVKRIYFEVIFRGLGIPSILGMFKYFKKPKYKYSIMSFNKSDFKSVMIFNSKEFIIPNDVIVCDESESEFSLEINCIVEKDKEGGKHVTIKKKTSNVGDSDCYIMAGGYYINHVYESDSLKFINTFYLLERCMIVSNFYTLIQRYAWVYNGILKCGEIFDVLAYITNTWQQGFISWNEDGLDIEFKKIQLKVIDSIGAGLSDDLSTLKTICSNFKELSDIVIDF